MFTATCHPREDHSCPMSRSCPPARRSSMSTCSAASSKGARLRRRRAPLSSSASTASPPPAVRPASSLCTPGCGCVPTAPASGSWASWFRPSLSVSTPPGPNRPSSPGARGGRGRRDRRQAAVRGVFLHRPRAHSAVVGDRHGDHLRHRHQCLLRHDGSGGGAAGLPGVLPQRRDRHQRDGRSVGTGTARGDVGQPLDGLRPDRHGGRDLREDPSVLAGGGSSVTLPVGGVILPGDGRALAARNSRPTVKVGPHNGSRLIGVLESELPPGGGFPGHVHEEYEEVFYVLGGEIDYFLHDAWITARSGSTVFVPPGQAHGFRNTTDKLARHLAIASPAEAMTMVEELTRAEPSAVAEILARYRSRPGPTA